jgi:hypothetical protein
MPKVLKSNNRDGMRARLFGPIEKVKESNNDTYSLTKHNRDNSVSVVVM